MGGLWFWILFTIASIVLIACLEKDSGTGATITLLAASVLYFLCAGNSFHEMLLWMRDNPGRTIGLALLYFFVGAIWSFAKFYFFLKKKKRKGHDFKYVTVDGNKGRIIAWITYWPFSVAWAAINQPVRYISTEIYHLTSNIYEKILVSVRDENPDEKDPAKS